MKGKISKLDCPISSSSTITNDPITLPFKEWSDKELREENWNSLRVATAKSQKTDRSSHSKRSRDSSPVEIPANDEALRFEDEQKIDLPYSILPFEWKSAAKAFPRDTKFEVYVNSDHYPDLISENKHLLQSEFMRSFISSIHMLIYLGNTTRFEIEFVSPNFKPSMQGMPWRPWHHIYSSNSSSGPTVNKIGKYVVRLFWMGSWRIVYVDDRLPLDMKHHILLPILGTKKVSIITVGSKSLRRAASNKSDVTISGEHVVQLWPFLLSKALLKIAGLSWYEDREIIDFDIVQCLTGWSPQKINTKGIPSAEIWDICWAYTNHFSWPPQESHMHLHVKHNRSRKSLGSDKSKMEFSQLHIEKEEKGNESKMKVPTVVKEESHSCYLVARCNDLRDIADSDKQKLSPCWSHEFLIHETRDIPLRRPMTVTAELELWKRIRWLNWASEKGMIPGEELQEKFMNYKVVSPFRKVYEHVVHEQPSKVSIPAFIEPETIIDKSSKASKKDKKDKKNKGDKSNKEENKKSKMDIKSTVKDNTKDTIRSKESKMNKDSGVKKSFVDFKSNAPDTSFWIDHEEICNEINTLVLYFRPSRFKTKIEITDIDQKHPKVKKEDEITDSDQKKQKGKKGGDGQVSWKVLMNPLTVQKCRNEPVYIFTDSIDSKLIVISFAQSGYVDSLQQPEITNEMRPVLSDQFTECDFCLAALVRRVKGNTTAEEVKDYVPVPKLEAKLVKHYRPWANFVLEKYNWKNDRLGKTVASASSYGAKSSALEFGPGRKVFKLWIKSETPYIMHIFSDTNVVVGSLETILHCMTEESQLLQDMCVEIANNFGKLIQAFGTSEFPAQLKAFYNSYKPQKPLTKLECAMVHDTFYELLCELVDDILSKKEVCALRILFLRSQYNRHRKYPEGYNLCTCYDEEDVEYLKLTERYVVKIQAFFRGIHERYSFKCHNTSHKCYKTTADSLFNIYADIFSVNNRLTICPNLIRAFLKHPNLNKIKRKYDLYGDLENVVAIKDESLCSKLHESYQWALICRQPFFVKSTVPIPIKIDLFDNVGYYVVRVIDNDTCNEIKRYTNNVAATEYKSNSKGYTVVCYFWSPSLKNVSYNLTFTTQKEIDYQKISLTSPNTQFNSFDGTYTPNINNTICQYLVRMRSEYSLLTVRFSSCYPNAIINLKLYDDSDTLLKQITGKGEVILPAIFLEYPKKPYCPSESSSQGGTNVSSKGKIKRAVKSLSQSNVSPNKFQDIKSFASLQGPEPLKLQGRQSSVSFHSRISEPIRPHIYPYYHRTESSTDTKKNTVMKDPAEYRIEVSVLDDSWPLSAEEWRNIENSTAESAYKIAVKESLLRRLSIRKKVIKRPSTQQLLQKPFWVIQTIHSVGEVIEVIPDRRRIMEKNEIKSKWNEYDVSRVRRGEELRKEFLRNFRISNPDPLTGDDARSLVKEVFDDEVLPPFDLSQYMTQDPEEVIDRRKLKSNAEMEMDISREIALMEEAEIRHKENVEKVQEFAKEQAENLNLVNNWFNDVRQESYDMIEDAMKLRLDTIHARIEAQKAAHEAKKLEQKSKKDKKDEKGKKGKKDKKG